MFHVMLVLFPIILIAVFGSLVLFGIASVLVGLFGGATAALLIKNKTVKQLLLIGFCIFLFIGALCLLSVIGLLAGLTAKLIVLLGIIMLALIAMLGGAGIIIASTIINKTIRVILIILFSGACAASVLLACLAIVLK